MTGIQFLYNPNPKVCAKDIQKRAKQSLEALGKANKGKDREAPGMTRTVVINE